MGVTMTAPIGRGLIDVFPEPSGRIVSGPTPGMAPAKPVCRQDESLHDPVFLQRLDGELRTRRLVPTQGREERGEEPLITSHEADEDESRELDEATEHGTRRAFAGYLEADTPRRVPD
jgi:hypothetical protein